MAETEGTNKEGAFFNERTMSLIAQKIKHEIPVDSDTRAKYEAQLKSMQEQSVDEKPEPEITPADEAVFASVLDESQKMVSTKDILTPDEELRMSAFRTKANEFNKMPTLEEEAKERAKIIAERKNLENEEVDTSKVDPWGGKNEYVDADGVIHVRGEAVSSTSGSGDETPPLRENPSLESNEEGEKNDSKKPTEGEPKREEHREEDRGRKVPRSEDELREEMENLDKIKNLSMRSRALGRLAEKLIASGKYDFGSIVADKKALIDVELAKQRTEDLTAKISGIPEGGDEKAWRKWSRARITQVLLNGGQIDSGPGGVFSAVAEDKQFGGGRRSVDGSLYMPSVIEKRIKGEIDPETGRMLNPGELENAKELGRVWAEWKKAHKNLAGMVTAYDSKSNSSYGLPNNKLNAAIFNKLESEDGLEKDGGSKKVAKALQIYWAMAHWNKNAAEDKKTPDEKEADRILNENHLFNIPNVTGGFRSLYNDNPSVEEASEIRKAVGVACGGTYYESIGFMYAGFFGVSAYGSNSTLPGIDNQDIMGRLYNTECNLYKNKKERDGSKKDYRWMPDVAANSLVVYENGRRKKGSFKLETDTDVSSKKSEDVELIHLGLSPDNFQVNKDAPDPRTFYFIRERGSGKNFVAYKKMTDKGLGTDFSKNKDIVDRHNDIEITKAPENRNIWSYELDETKYEEITLNDLIKEGRINEVDWAKGISVFGLMAFRERAAVGVYKLFAYLEDDISKLGPDLLRRKDTFEEAMPQYNMETIGHIRYLWLYSLITKNTQYWVRDDKKDELRLLVKEAIGTEFINNDQAQKINNVFRLNLGGDVSRLWDGTYSPFRRAK